MTGQGQRERQAVAAELKIAHLSGLDDVAPCFRILEFGQDALHVRQSYRRLHLLVLEGCLNTARLRPERRLFKPEHGPLKPEHCLPDP